jgi:pyrroloquinoline quinone biosynthesis protein E
MIEPPLGLLAELTHRCPLGCPYCSNPIALEPRSRELSTETWGRVMREAAALGVLQVHLSGGEPTARPDLEAIVRAAAEAGLYTNLITSGVLLDGTRIAALAAAGLHHVQLSIQHAEAAEADRIAHFRGAHLRKLAVAKQVRETGLALTINAVLHRQNLAALESMIALALTLGAGRLEVAHTQYHGWALANRAALLPSRGEAEAARRLVEDARERLKGRLLIDYVAPDYHATRPKACMGGWGRRFLNITPAGAVLPCHAAESLPDLHFDQVTERSLEAIWTESEAFNRFRGTRWMPEPCRGCENREIDWGGCRCQAFALAGDASEADPVCDRSRHRPVVDMLIGQGRTTTWQWRGHAVRPGAIHSRHEGDESQN